MPVHDSVGFLLCKFTSCCLNKRGIHRNMMDNIKFIYVVF